MSTKKEKTPIISPCGDVVKVGQTFYEVIKKSVASYNKVKPWTGEPSVSLVKHKVIKIDESFASRSFWIRSDRGCETQYSVKNECLPPRLFTKFYNAKKYANAKHKEDIDAIQDKIDEKQERINLYKETLKKLKAIKY